MRGRPSTSGSLSHRSGGQNLEFAIEVDNPTDLPLAEVYFGSSAGNRVSAIVRTPIAGAGAGTQSRAVSFHEFCAGGYGGGNLGIRYDAAGFTYPGDMQMGWMEFFNRKTNLGLYYANHDPEPRQSALYFELRPFTKSAAGGG